jgi:hypothetical protein
MITNTDVFNALKIIKAFCDSISECEKCPLENKRFCDLNFGTYQPPSDWDVESLRPILDPASTTLGN